MTKITTPITIPDSVADERVLDVRQAAAVIGCSVDWLRACIKRGAGPTIVRFGPRTSGIRQAELKRWIAAHAQPTAGE